MKGKEIIKDIIREEMPDIEQVREKCLNQTADETLAEQNTKRKHIVFNSTKILATAAAFVLIIGLFNITTVIAFFKSVFYIPGIGITENESLVSAVLNEPVLIKTNAGDFRLEFANKVKREDGRCEILIFFTTDRIITLSDITPVSALVNGEKYELSDEGISGYSGVECAFNVSNYDFPDVNEFDLQFKNTTTRITMSELCDDEKIPSLSDEINGVTLAVYKYRGNNRMFGIDVINNNVPNDVDFMAIARQFSRYDADGNLMSGSYSSSGRPFWSKDYGLGYNVYFFDKDEDKVMSKITVNQITIRYDYWDNGNKTTKTDAPKVTIPVPKDGETIYTDIKVPFYEVIYEITEIRRKGDSIYYKDNSSQIGTEEEMQRAIANCEKRIGFVSMENFDGNVRTDSGVNESKITGFNPDSESFEMIINSYSITYYGGYTITFD